MMKRLGFWDRLAVVAGVLFSLIWPTWLVIRANDRIANTLGDGYQSCLENSLKRQGPPADCAKIWFDDNRALYQGFDDWTTGILYSLLIAGIVYLLIRIAVAVVRWVWRGRDAAK